MLDTCKRLEKEGFEVTYLPVGKDGRVSPEPVRAAITDKTILVSIMLANNEIGTVNPIAEIGAVVKEKGALFHVDAVQGVGKVPFDVNAAKVDLASLSAHKMYGPKGVGALYVRRKPRVRITAQIDGGGHERGMRSGTLNVPGIVGFGKAAELARTEMATEAARLLALRERLREAIQSQLDRHVRQRVDGAPAAGQPEHQLRLRRGRGADDGDQGRRGVVGLGLHVGVARAVVRAARARRRRGAGAHVDPLRPRPLQHRGRGRLRRRSTVVDKVKKLRELSPLYEMAQGGHRSEEHHLGRSLSDKGEQQSWRTAKRSSSTTRTRATSAASTRTTRTSAPAWSARPRAATS